MGHTGKAVVQAITLDYSASADVERTRSDRIGDLEPIACLPGGDVMDVAKERKDRVTIKPGRCTARRMSRSQQKTLRRLRT